MNEIDEKNTAPEADNRGQWFVVHTLSGHENKVCERIRNQIRICDNAGVYEAVVPMHKTVEIRDRQKKIRNEKVFPGYILVRMDLYEKDDNVGSLIKMNDQAWSLVRSVQGVLGFLGAKGALETDGVRPIPLTDSEARDILCQSDADAAPAPTMTKFEVGETVHVNDGPFEGSEATVVEINPERGQLKVMIPVFNRSTQVELESWQVERAN